MDRAPWWLVVVMGVAVGGIAVDDLRLRERLRAAEARTRELEANAEEAAAEEITRARSGKRKKGAKAEGRGQGKRVLGAGDPETAAQRRAAFRGKREAEAKAWVDEFAASQGLSAEVEEKLAQVVTTDMSAMLDLRVQVLENALSRQEAEDRMTELRATLHAHLVEVLGEEGTRAFEEGLPMSLRRMMVTGAPSKGASGDEAAP